MDKKTAGFVIGVTLMAGAVGTGLVVGLSYLTKFLDLDDSYLPAQKVEYLTKELGLDDSILYKSDIYKMRHKNNGEPINFYFAQNFPKECVAYSLDAIDYLFNMVHDVNPLYTYSVVNSSSEADIVFYNNTLSEDVLGLANLQTNSVTIDLSQPVFFNEDGSYKSDVVSSVAKHEMMHQFGFRDTYTRGDDEVLYQNSVMNGISKNLSTNEYGNLIVNYVPNTADENLPALLASLRERIVDYTSRLDICTQFSSKLKTFQNVSELDEISGNINLELKIRDYTYCFSITNDDYTFSVTANGKTISQQGKVLKMNNNMIVLQNVHWQEKIRSFNYTINKDISIAKNQNTFFIFLDDKVQVLTNLNAELTI